MKTYAKSFATFWTGATAKRLAGTGPYPKLLASYLFTSPAALAADNYGVFYVERDTMQRHLECDAPTLDAAVDVLAVHQFAFWDRDSEWVWVREAAAWQYSTPLLPKDFVCTNARKWYRQLPRNPWLGFWFDRYVKDLCLQHNEKEWVNRREWDGDLPDIAGHIATVKTRAAVPPPTTRTAPAFDRDRAISRLRAMTINGAIGNAISAAITKLEQGDVPLDVIDRQLMETCLEELGAQVEHDAARELANFKPRMTPEAYERALQGARVRLVRETLRLPVFE